MKKIGLAVNLTNEHCGLSHGPGIDTSTIKAVDYLVCPVGTIEGCVEEKKADLVIPICAECRDGLPDKEWTLVYCLGCNNSQWICRKLARKLYRHNIIWNKGCPKCGEKWKGTYFTD